MYIHIDNQFFSRYASRMLEPYKRDLIAKSLFRIVEIVTGASFISVWFSPSTMAQKVAVSILLVLIFIVAIAVSPSASPEGGTYSG